jgi:hypothetical protein
MTLYARQMATLDQHRVLGQALERARAAQAERAEAARVHARFNASVAKTKALEAHWLEGLAAIEGQLTAGDPSGRRRRGGGIEPPPLPLPELPSEPLAELPSGPAPHAEPEGALDPIDPAELDSVEGPAELAALLERAAAGAADPATMDRLLEMAGEWVEGSKEGSNGPSSSLPA